MHTGSWKVRSERGRQGSLECMFEVFRRRVPPPSEAQPGDGRPPPQVSHPDLQVYVHAVVSDKMNNRCGGEYSH